MGIDAASSEQPDESLADVELLRGAEAVHWLNTPLHADAWRRMYERCSWRNPYLSPEFFEAWTTCYGDLHESMLIVGRGRDGAVVALMPLARVDGRITGVGAHQAEYQGWLCGEAIAAHFFHAAHACLATAFPTEPLRFRMLSPRFPSGIIAGIAGADRRVLANAVERPLLELDAVAIKGRLAKKANKSKQSRLRRAGDLTFVRLDSVAHLERYFDQIITLYDFRQGAVNDVLPFRGDDRKKRFHLEWMRRAPGQLHITVMLIDDAVVAAQIDVMNGDTAHLAITASSPFYPDSSPGALHLYHDALMLADEGVTWLDLTPGGEWKQRFATGHDAVVGLIAWPTVRAARMASRRDWALQVARAGLRRVGLRPAKVKQMVQACCRITPSRLLTRLGRRFHAPEELRIYSVSPQGLPDTAPAGAKVNSLNDLCMFVPAFDWQSRHKFLSDALRRIESGERAYTVSVDDKLAHIGWLVPNQSEGLFSEVGQKFQYPAPGAVLYDFFTTPEFQGRGYYQSTVLEMLDDLKRDGATSVAYISVLAGNGASRHVIEKVGFQYLCSLRRHGSIVRNA